MTELTPGTLRYAAFIALQDDDVRLVEKRHLTALPTEEDEIVITGLSEGPLALFSIALAHRDRLWWVTLGLEAIRICSQQALQPRCHPHWRTAAVFTPLVDSLMRQYTWSSKLQAVGLRVVSTWLRSQSPEATYRVAQCFSVTRLIRIAQEHLEDGDAVEQAVQVLSLLNRDEYVQELTIQSPDTLANLIPIVLKHCLLEQVTFHVFSTMFFATQIRHCKISSEVADSITDAAIQILTHDPRGRTHAILLAVISNLARRKGTHIVLRPSQTAVLESLAANPSDKKLGVMAKKLLTEVRLSNSA